MEQSKDQMAVPNPQNNARATSYPKDNNRPDEWVQYGTHFLHQLWPSTRFFRVLRLIGWCHKLLHSKQEIHFYQYHRSRSAQVETTDLR